MKDNSTLLPWQQACIVLYEESNGDISKFIMPNGGLVVVVRDEFDTNNPKHCRDCLLAWYDEHDSAKNSVEIHSKDHGEA